MAGSVIPKQHRRDVVGLRKNLRKLASQKLGKKSSPTFGAITLSDLTASRLVWTNASKQLASKDLIDLVAGTANQITATDNGDGSVTLSLSSPTIEVGSTIQPDTDDTYNLGLYTPANPGSVDQSYSGGAANLDDDIYGTRGRGQTFTAGVSATCDKVEIYARRVGTPGDIVVSLYATSAGLPTGSALASKTLSANGWSTSYDWREFAFTSPPTLASGTVYALLVEDSAGDGSSSHCIEWLGSIPGGYGGGNRLWSNTLPGNYAADAGNDYEFRTYYGSSPAVEKLWSDLYLKGDISDSINSWTVANVQEVLDWTNQDVQTTASPTFVTTTLSGLTATRLVASDGSKTLVSSDLVNWVAGTANQVIVADDADGTITLSLPQDIHTGASPQWTTVDLTGITDGNVPYMAASAAGFADSPIIVSGTETRIGGAVNYTAVEADGTVEFNGDATVWNDENVDVSTLGLLGLLTGPDVDQFQDNTGTDIAVETYAFAVGEEISGKLEIPHSYKEGSDFTFHVHWQGIAAPTGTDKVQWQLKYSFVGVNETIPAETTLTVETDFDTQYEMKISSFAAITGDKMGDQFLFNLKRIAASTDEYGGDALVATVGIHYECDTQGSRQVTTK